MPTATERRSTDAQTVVSRYFEALGRRDVEAAAACWAPDGIDRFSGEQDLHGPEGVRAYFSELFAAVPDFAMVVEDTVAEGCRVAVHWHATGTFAGRPLQGIEATGARLDLEGLDLLRVRDGLLVHNLAVVNSMALARQIGLLPPRDSPTERRMRSAFNARTRTARKLAAREAERVADGVWLIRGGVPRTMNAYLLEEEGGGVTAFDTGIRQMGGVLAATGASLGGIVRVVLGHAHVDHRSGAAALGAPVYCHLAEVADAEGDAGLHYFTVGELGIPARWAYPSLLRYWDGGPVRIAGTVAEGDEVCGFRVVHLPGHAPGQIALLRESDGLALTSDCFYTLDIETSLKGAPRVPNGATNLDTEQARESLRKLAEIGPATAWPGHADPVTGDVAAQLRRAADTT